MGSPPTRTEDLPSLLMKNWTVATLPGGRNGRSAPGPRPQHSPVEAPPSDPQDRAGAVRNWARVRRLHHCSPRASAGDPLQVLPYVPSESGPGRTAEGRGSAAAGETRGGASAGAHLHDGPPGPRASAGHDPAHGELHMGPGEADRRLGEGVRDAEGPGNTGDRPGRVRG